MVNIGHNFEKQPFSSCRSKVSFVIWTFWSRLILIVGGISYEINEIDYDYSKYLGPNYKETQKKKNVKLMVSNHVSYLDAPILNMAFTPSFCPTLGFKNIPIFGRILTTLSCIFIPRGSSDDEKQKAVDAICDRVMQNELEPALPPLVIFPEGGVGNNAGLVSFKRGAFTPEKPIKPVFMKFYHDGVCPSLTLGLNTLMFL